MLRECVFILARSQKTEFKVLATHVLYNARNCPIGVSRFVQISPTPQDSLNIAASSKYMDSCVLECLDCGEGICEERRMSSLSAVNRPTHVASQRVIGHHS